MAPKSNSEMVSFAALASQGHANTSTNFSTAVVPPERYREAIIKKIFGILNGVGWSATFVGSLTLTGIGTMGLGVPAILTMTAATLPPGTIFGFLHTNDEINKEDQKEKNLVVDINLALEKAYKKQIELIAHLMKADSLLIEKLIEFAKKLNLSLPADLRDNSSKRDAILVSLAQQTIPDHYAKDFQYIVLLSQAIHQAAYSLKLMNVPLTFKSKKDLEINCETVNDDIKDLKKEFVCYGDFLKQESSKAVLQIYVDKKTNKTVHYANEMVRPANVRPKETGLISRFKNISKKIYYAGNSFGIGLGMGTIFCGITLAASPPGWLIGAAIIGIVVTSSVLGVAGHYLDAPLRAKQAAQIENLQTLQMNVAEYSKQQIDVAAHLSQRVLKLKTLENNIVPIDTRRPPSSSVSLSAFPSALLAAGNAAVVSQPAASSSPLRMSRSEQ